MRSSARTAVVTGANRGLGLAFVDQLQRRGWRVVAGVRDPARAGELRALSPAAVVEVDTGDAASIAAFGATVVSEGPVGLLVNNAGLMSASARPVDERPDDGAAANGALAELRADALAALLRVNSIGPVLVAQALAPALTAGSTIVNVSSRLGSIGLGRAGGYGYAMSKAALNMATVVLARELGPRGVVTVSVSPGWVRTDMGGASAALSPDASTGAIADLVERLGPSDNGTFVDHLGEPVPW